jgi:peptidylprolyl isomerase
VNRRLAAVALSLVLVLGACGSDGDDDVSTGDDATTTTTEATSGSGSGDCRTAEEAATAETPEVDAPTEKATEMVVTDLEVGCGAEITAGEVVNVEVHYLGKALSTGEVFDASFGGEPAAFPVGAGRLIEGWDTGLVGMKEGGRRQLLIPGDLAYGAMGSPPDIGPDDTLVFVIDLLSVTA